MARTVYSGSRTFDCDIEAEVIRRDKQRYAYAVLVNATRQYRTGASGGWTNNGQAVALVESNYPIYVETVTAAGGRQNKYLCTFGKRVSGGVAQETRFSFRVTFDASYRPAGQTEDKTLHAVVFAQCTVGVRTGSVANLQCNSNANPEDFSRIDDALEVNASLGRTFTDATSYSTQTTVRSFGATVANSEVSSGETDFDIYLRNTTEGNEIGTVDVSNIDNPTFESGTAWLNYCKSL